MNKDNVIKQLFNAGKKVDDNGLTSFEESKLRRALEQNDQLMRNNKDIFGEQEPKFFTCKRYDPCPICFKCMVKASHLFVKCQTCNIPLCAHTYDHRRKMIRRFNFSVVVDRKTMDIIKNLAKTVK